MVERPILFSGAMVRAILSGTKTQTRRVVKPQPIPQHHIARAHRLAGRHDWAVLTNYASTVKWLNCPHGEPGDRLWVREAWGLHGYGDYTYWLRDSIVGRSQDDLRASWELAYAADAESPYDFWRPSIHMPRWASRLTLEVTGVRVERLNDISEEDAVAEGVEVHMMPEEWRAVRQQYGRNEAIAFDREPSADLIAALRLRDVTHVPARPMRSAVSGFSSLWESINGAGSWESNPWVWAITFKRVTP